MATSEAKEINPDYLRGLIKSFGREIFAYCLNIQENDVAAMEADADRMVANESSPVLSDMVKQLISLKLSAALENYPIDIVISHLPKAGPEEQRISLFNLWRLRSGGELFDFRTGDPVLDALAPELSDAYPITLIYRHIARTPWSFMLTPDLHISADAMMQFGRSVLADPILKQLFPNDSEMTLDAVTYVARSTGSAGSMQLAVLPSAIFRNAYLALRLRRQRSAADLRAAVEMTLSTLRSAAGGASVQVPAWVGIGNIALPSDNVDLLWGKLRTYPQPAELEMIPASARPPITNDGGMQQTLGAILETTFSLQTLIDKSRTSEPVENVSDFSADEYAKLDERISHLSLAAMLATERMQPAACTRLWTVIFDPFSFGGNLSFAIDVNPPVAFHVFSADEVQAMQDWIRTLHDTPVKKFEIPRRRILSAVAERKDPVDGFVDAVIAWESLFAGTDQGELSFRICAAMASLLREPGDDRLAELRRLSKLYVKRSKVVHGAQDITTADAIESRDYAVRAILDCIKKLFLDHPEMLQDADRSRKIILSL